MKVHLIWHNMYFDWNLGMHYPGESCFNRMQGIASSNTFQPANSSTQSTHINCNTLGGGGMIFVRVQLPFCYFQNCRPLLHAQRATLFF